MCKMCDMNECVNFIKPFDYRKEFKRVGIKKHPKGLRKDLISTYDGVDGLFWGEFNLIRYDDDEKYYIEFGGDDIGKMPISYCPFCGNKLENKDAKNEKTHIFKRRRKKS